MDHTGIFFFDPEDRIYADHFPGNPVVPGSLVIQAFITAAGSIGYTSTALSIKNFRFTRFIAPGEYRYQIEEKEEEEKSNNADNHTPGFLTCKLYDNNELVSSGKIGY
ncbi:MAG: hypothetical protein GY754_26680 [bacterium]|nr:hypothetical protein [bacterium]